MKILIIYKVNLKSKFLHKLCKEKRLKIFYRH